jgi:hypothetical protein
MNFDATDPQLPHPLYLMKGQKIYQLTLYIFRRQGLGLTNQKTRKIIRNLTKFSDFCTNSTYFTHCVPFNNSEKKIGKNIVR